MNREGIRRLAAEELGVKTSPYRFASDYEEFKKYCDDLISLRDKIVAHYDATTSECKVVADGLISRKMASATFLPDEITKLKNFAFALLETLRQILTEQESC